MREIKLTQDKVTIVDDADFEWLNQWKWYAIWDGWRWYAVRNSTDANGKKHTIYMHRQIMDAQPGQQVDHEDRDGLNNQREKNLRFCTGSQNQANRKKWPGGSSQFKGVCWHKQARKWRAQIGVNCKLIHLGYFEDEIEAALAYNEAAIKHFEKFARPNIIMAR